MVGVVPKVSFSSVDLQFDGLLDTTGLRRIVSRLRRGGSGVRRLPRVVGTGALVLVFRW